MGNVARVSWLRVQSCDVVYLGCACANVELSEGTSYLVCVAVGTVEGQAN